MRKAITPIISTVLLVLIVIAIIAVAYGWFLGIFRTTQDHVANQTGRVVTNMNKMADIDSVTCANDEIKLAIKNIGSETIAAGDVAIYFDNAFNDTNHAEITPNHIVEFRGAADCANLRKVKITDPAQQAIVKDV